MACKALAAPRRPRLPAEDLQDPEQTGGGLSKPELAWAGGAQGAAGDRARRRRQ